jgi:hypothetical protein
MCQVKQLGKPLTEEVLDAMPEEEKQFWYSFLEGVSILQKQLLASGAAMRLTEELRVQYQRALDEFQGAQYCQIQQIKQIFHL